MEIGVSYFSSRDLRHVRQDLEDMVAHGCTQVVHCFTETDLLHYRGSMQEVTGATREAGLEVWLDPWGVTGIFTGRSFSGFLIDHPETRQLRSDGRRAPIACPNHPETRRFLLEWVDAAAEAGGQVAFWDEPHFDLPVWRGDYSGAWACCCEHCREGFREFAGGPMPERMDDQVRAFRDRCLIELVSELCSAARKRGMRNVLCLLPVDLEGAGLTEPARSIEESWRGPATADGEPADANPWRSAGIRDWDAAAAIPDLDIFSSDPYWYVYDAEPEPFVRGITRRAVEVAQRHAREVQIWVQAFLVPAGREEELAVGLRVAAEEGATHLAAWSYRANESISGARCERPDVVWRLLGESFRELRDKTASRP